MLTNDGCRLVLSDGDSAVLVHFQQARRLVVAHVRIMPMAWAARVGDGLEEDVTLAR